MANTRAGILGTGHSYPEGILTNADLEKMVETSDEWITTRTGIKQRRKAAPSWVGRSARVDINYGSSAPFTLGVEEELQLVSAEHLEVARTVLIGLAQRSDLGGEREAEEVPELRLLQVRHAGPDELAGAKAGGERTL